MLKTILIAAIGLFSARVFANPVALHVLYQDGSAFTEGLADEVEQKLKETVSPDIQVLRASVKSPWLPHSSAGIRKAMAAEIKKALAQTSQKIDYLIISTHGNTSGGAVSSFKYIGKISDTGRADADSTQFFDLLKDHTAIDLKIVLNSCNAICGTDSSAANRARTILNGLNAPNGIIFGSTTYENWNTSVIPSPKIAVLFGLSSFVVAAVGLGPASELDMSQSEFLFELGKMTSMYWFLHASATPLVQKMFSLAKKGRKMNFGRLFKFNNGNFESVEPIGKAELYERIQDYRVSGMRRPFTCRDIFLNAP